MPAPAVEAAWVLLFALGAATRTPASASEAMPVRTMRALRMSSLPVSSTLPSAAEATWGRYSHDVADRELGIVGIDLLPVLRHRLDPFRVADLERDFSSDNPRRHNRRCDTFGRQVLDVVLVRRVDRTVYRDEVNILQQHPRSALRAAASDQRAGAC